MSVSQVRALARCGHQTDALRTVTTTRAALAEIGLEPGPQLRRAETEAYANADGTGAPATASPPTGKPGDEPTIEYAIVEGRHVAYTALSSGPRDLVVLNPAMITIDGLLDDPHPRHALAHLGEHARIICLDRHGVGLSDPLDKDREPLDEWTDDIVQVLDALDIEAAQVFANFDTGTMAIEFAARHPERVTSLVLAHCFASYQHRDQYPHGVEASTAYQLIHDAVSPDVPEHRINTVPHAAPSVAGDAASANGGHGSASAARDPPRRPRSARSPSKPISATASHTSSRLPSWSIGGTASTSASVTPATSPNASPTPSWQSSPAQTHSGSPTPPTCSAVRSSSSGY